MVEPDEATKGVKTTVLGSNNEAGETMQYVVKRDTWFGSYHNAPPSTETDCDKKYSFVGCTVSPGFEFADFEMASNAELKAAFDVSAHAMIDKLTVGLP